MKRNRFRNINMPHHTVNGTLYMAVRYRYNVTVIFPLKIEKKKVGLIRIFGYQYFSEVVENSRIVTVMSVTSPPAKTTSRTMSYPKNIDSVASD